MPTLPAAGYYTPQAPSVSPPADAGTPYQSSAGASPEAFGAGIGAALSHFSDSAAAASAHFGNIQSIYNEVSADDQTNKAEDRIQKILYGDPDKPGDGGFYSLRGANALQESPNVHKQIETILQEGRSNLSNTQQQMRFDKQTRQIRNTVLAQVGRHTDSEFRTYQLEEAKANSVLNTGKVSGAAAEGDQSAFDSYVSKSINDAQERAQRMGLPPAMADAEVQGIRQHAVKSWAESMAARGDAVGADSFVDRNKGALGDAYDNLKREFYGKAKQQQINNAVFGGSVAGPAPMIRGGAIQGRIAEAAQAQNVDPTTALATAQIESSMGRNLGARGNIFQLGAPEWAAAGGGPKGDPNTDIRNGITFLAQTQNNLQQKLGRAPQPWEVYLAHQQGVGGAAALLSNPNTPAGQIVPSRNVAANGGDPNAPASSFAQLWKSKFESVASRIGGISSAQAAETPAAAPAQPAGLLAVGDSIAAHLVRKAGVGGQESGEVAVYNPGDTAVSGYNPANVLKVIAGTPDEAVRGKNVVLSTGTSNDPKNTFADAIPEQIKALYAKGAASVTVMGTGTKFADRNDALAKIAAANNATFAGPLQKPAADGIHSSDPQAELAAVQQAIPAGRQVGQTQQAPAGQPGAAVAVNPPPPDPNMRPDSQVPGLQAKLAELDQRYKAGQLPADVYEGAYRLARERLNAAYTDEQRDILANKRASEKVVQDAENEVIADHYSDAPKLTATQVSIDPRFNSDPAARMRMLALLKPDRGGVDPAVSANTMHDLMRGISNGEVTDRSQIIDAFNAQPSRLSESHFNLLLKQFEDVRTPEGLKIGKDVDKLIAAVKGSITKSNPLLGNIDPSGDIQLGAFEEDIRNTVELMRKDKKTPAEIADYLSVKRFRDNPSLLTGYQKTIQESSADLARRMSAPPPPPPGTPGIVTKPSPFAAPGVPPANPASEVFTAPIPPVSGTVMPRQPGETPADYLKRTGRGAPGP